MLKQEALLTGADRILVWLKILTILIGGIGTILVVFLADVMTARLANPTGVAGVPAVTMSEESELQHWLGYKIALEKLNDKDVVFHVTKAFALATDPKQKSALDGVLVEHMPAGHFVHTKNILKELLGEKPEPTLTPSQMEAKLALLFLKENRLDETKEQIEHMVANLAGHGKEEAEEALEALQRGDLAAASSRLEHITGEQ